MEKICKYICGEDQYGDTVYLGYDEEGNYSLSYNPTNISSPDKDDFDDDESDVHSFLEGQNIVDTREVLVKIGAEVIDENSFLLEVINLGKEIRRAHERESYYEADEGRLKRLQSCMNDYERLIDNFLR